MAGWLTTIGSSGMSGLDWLSLIPGRTGKVFGSISNISQGQQYNQRLEDLLRTRQQPYITPSVPGTENTSYEIPSVGVPSGNIDMPSFINAMNQNQGSQRSNLSNILRLFLKR